MEFSDKTTHIENECAEKECCICYENIGIKNSCITDCGHSFCLSCLALSIRKNVACPMCRTNIIGEDDTNNIVSDDEDEDEDDDDDEYDETFICATENECSLEELSERLEKKGITYLDLVSMVIKRYSPAFRYEDLKNKHEMFYDVLDEADDEIIERQQFMEEDQIELDRFQVRLAIEDLLDDVMFVE